MKNIITIMKKELWRVFKDPKLIFSVFILPGLIIFLLYSLMGQAFSSMYTTDELKVHINNVPVEVTNNMEIFAESQNVILTFNNDILTDEEITELINLGELNLSITFNALNEISYVFKSIDISSYSALNLFIEVISSYQDDTIIVDGTTYNMGEFRDVTTQEEGENEISKQTTAILPMLLMTFLFTGALSFGPESIAGDKERGTMATLLATPTKRSEIAIGKIFSLSILSVLAGLSSFIGVMLSLPKLMGGGSETLTYQASDYLSILFLVVSAVLLIISVVSIISAYARTVKEATSYSSPFMILTMVIGISNFFMTGTLNIKTAVIPLYNIVQSLNMILSFEFNLTYYLITILSNLLITVFLAYVLTRQFKSEKIMFSK